MATKSIRFNLDLTGTMLWSSLSNYCWFYLDYSVLAAILIWVKVWRREARSATVEFNPIRIIDFQLHLAWGGKLICDFIAGWTPHLGCKYEDQKKCIHAKYFCRNTKYFSPFGLSDMFNEPSWRPRIWQYLPNRKVSRMGSSNSSWERQTLPAHRWRHW